MVYVRIRVAGGWVRDKLLGLPSKYDIDFALENSTGAKFALALQDWLHEKGMNHMKLAVIQQNPEKSKHLETGIRCVNIHTKPLLLKYLIKLI